VHNFFYVISGIPDPSTFCGLLCTQKIHLGSHASNVLVRTHFCVPDKFDTAAVVERNYELWYLKYHVLLLYGPCNCGNIFSTEPHIISYSI